MSNPTGYTLLELLMVIGVLALIAAIGSPFLFGFKTGLDLDEEANRIAATLRAAQSKAMTLQNYSSWGVYFNNTGDPYYDLFYGVDYPSGTVTDRFFLSQGTRYSAPASGTSITVLFAKRTGNPGAAATVVIESASTNPPEQKNVTVQQMGRIMAQ